MQLCDNPPLAFSANSGDCLSVHDWAQTWSVVYTKPRQEKSLAHDLKDRGVTYFLPAVHRQTSSGGRRRQNLYPLFPSYLFIAGEDDARLQCLKTKRTAHFIQPAKEQQETLRTELQALCTALHVAPKKVEIYKSLLPGVPVTVKSGPLKGVSGTIVSIQNARKLQLSVTILGVGAVVEIHADLVEK